MPISRPSESRPVSRLSGISGGSGEEVTQARDRESVMGAPSGGGNISSGIDRFCELQKQKQFQE